MLSSFRQAPIASRAVAGALLVGFLLALGLAASPEFHDRVHHDGGHREHQCLAATIGSGGCEDATPAPTLAAFVAGLFSTVPVDCSRSAESLFLSRSVLEHAPPFVS